MYKMIGSLALLLLSIAAVAQKKPNTPAEEQSVLQAEHAWLIAASTPDANAMDRLLAEDFIGTTPGGLVVHKTDIMPGEDAANKLPKLHAENPTIQIHGDTAVLMAKLVNDSGDRAMNSTSVFRQAEGKWKLVALHLSAAMK